ncbi:phage baseplate assembly protein V [Dyella sp. ASV21]|uniref:phage baseplate assembly protein V n=1 Tax=Dyella sp. ASV21 TaxID=2795114 RepID=UPI0018ECC499|nr:phage baseplate assembly protein V [Dyella sp. ASV21]
MQEDPFHAISNLLRIGTIAEIAGKRVRVKVGGLLTKPLPWFASRAGKHRGWNPPSVGEQVMVLSPNGNLAAGVVLPSIYSDANDVPEGASPDNVLLLFGDGAALLYDAAAHVLKATLPAGGRIEVSAPGGAAINGNVDIDGTLHVTQAVTTDRTIDAKGTITSNDDVKAAGISLVKHPHKVTSAPGMTSPAVAS